MLLLNLTIIHISNIENKLSRTVGILYKIRHYMPQKTFKMLYYALIHPHLLYDLSIWGSTYPSYLKKLSILQNKAIKLISGGSYRCPATPYNCNLKILKLEDLFIIEVGKLVHFHFQRKLPLNLSNLFQLQCNISNRNKSSKNHNLLYVPSYKTSRLQRSIKNLGVKIRNKIPP